jgi:hypothetical protein
MTRERKRPAAEDKAVTLRRLAQPRGWTVEPALDGTYVLRDERGTLQAADWAREGFGLSLKEIERVLKESG